MSVPHARRFFYWRVEALGRRGPDQHAQEREAGDERRQAVQQGGAGGAVVIRGGRQPRGPAEAGHVMAPRCGPARFADAAASSHAC